ncbi:NAD(P)-binding domain-containing protein [Actinosynnema pretiosum subsp. pretiosum]|uniref:NAD(P)-binding domain-containing protein n=1 Tax=Actinosynnema pretiosum subsp. pretiosum TaxID=103721 RepID=A0AA45LDC1_9PSEU|nr:NAD(P)-binding domain-containing protein [Actinosynnema pretiosum subsp. pretiosum]
MGIIGSGRVGGALARLAVAHGLRVVVSNSRGPETLADLVAELGPHARAATPEEAALACDLAFAAVPVRAYRDLPATALRDRTVVDAINHDPARHGHVPGLDGATTSELVQAHLSGSRVVKACNNIFSGSLLALARPSGAPDRSALPVAGDDPGARAEVAAFLDVIGYDVVDAGPLAEGWRWQPGTPAHLVHAGATVHEAVPAGVERVRAALAAATR